MPSLRKNEELIPSYPMTGHGHFIPQIFNPTNTKMAALVADLLSRCNCSATFSIFNNKPFRKSYCLQIQLSESSSNPGPSQHRRRSIMQLRNVLLQLALIASTVFAAPTPAIETRTPDAPGHIYYFTADNQLNAGQPSNLLEYPYFCYVPKIDTKLYYHNPPNCGPYPVQSTATGAVIA